MHDVLYDRHMYSKSKIYINMLIIDSIFVSIFKKAKKL
jgi:hypothetical protein